MNWIHKHKAERHKEFPTSCVPRCDRTDELVGPEYARGLGEGDTPRV
jgi:hypothetical protein